MLSLLLSSLSSSLVLVEELLPLEEVSMELLLQDELEDQLVDELKMEKSPDTGDWVHSVGMVVASVSDSQVVLGCGVQEHPCCVSVRCGVDATRKNFSNS